MSNIEQDTTTPSDVLFHRVYVPEFVKQCQARGLHFSADDVEQLGDLLKIAYALRVREAVEQDQTADRSREFLKTAAAALEVDTYGSRATVLAEKSAASASLLSDPEVCKAVSAIVGNN